MNFIVKPNFKICGAMFGKNIKAYQDLLLSLSSEEQIKLYNSVAISKYFMNESLEITPEMVDIRIQAKDGFDVAMDSSNFIILDTNLSDELILEGIARELVSKVQNLRKTKDFDIQDRITLSYDGDEVMDTCIKEYNEFIKTETLATSIVKNSSGEAYDLNGHMTKLNVERV